MAVWSRLRALFQPRAKMPLKKGDTGRLVECFPVLPESAAETTGAETGYAPHDAAPAPECLPVLPPGDDSCVRPLPYPFARAVAIPGDACQLGHGDAVAFHAPLVRGLGLDVSSSFFVHSEGGNVSGPPPLAAFGHLSASSPTRHRSAHLPSPGASTISGTLSMPSTSPMPGATSVGGGEVHYWSLLLTMFHRGWVDHLHGWAAGHGACYSLAATEPVACAAGNPEFEWDLLPTLGEAVLGLWVEIEVLSSGSAVSQLELAVRHTDGELVASWGLAGAGNSGKEGCGEGGCGEEGRGAEKDGEKRRGAEGCGDDRDAAPVVADGRVQWTFPLPAAPDGGHGTGHEGRRRFARYLDFTPLNGCVPSRGMERPFTTATLRVTCAEPCTVHLCSLRPVSFSRELARQQVRLLQDHGLRPFLCTNHMYTDPFLLLPDWLPPGVDLQTQRDGHGALREVPVAAHGARTDMPGYWSGALQELGVEHTNLAMTRLAGRNWPFGTTYPDGSAFLTSARYNPLPDPERDARYPLITPRAEWAENLGVHISRLLAQRVPFGHCEILYTHAGPVSASCVGAATFGASKHGEESGAAWVQMEEAGGPHPHVLDVARRLAGCHYGNSRKGSRVSDDRRVWVPSATVLLRHRQVNGQLRNHLSRMGDDIAIARWTDPVTGRIIPDSSFPSLDLHAQSFRVEHPPGARIFCEGEAVNCLRRSVDEDGRGWVSVLDDSRPVVILDDCGFAGRGTMLGTNARWELPGDRTCRDTAADCSTGQDGAALSLRAQEKGNAFVELLPHALDSFETHGLRLRYGADGGQVFVAWTDTRGNDFAVLESPSSGRGARTAGVCACVAAPGPPDGLGWRTLAVGWEDFSDSTCWALPRGRVVSVRVGLLNAPAGAGLVVNRIDFLRCTGLPCAGEVLVAGRVSNREGAFVPGMRVELQSPGGEDVRAATTDATGWFYFPGVTRGSRVSLRCGASCSVRGEVFSAVMDNPECHIVVD